MWFEIGYFISLWHLFTLPILQKRKSLKLICTCAKYSDACRKEYTYIDNYVMYNVHSKHMRQVKNNLYNYRCTKIPFMYNNHSDLKSA